MLDSASINDILRRYPGWCSFCRKDYQEVGPLAQSNDEIFICYNCTQLCMSFFVGQSLTVPRADYEPNKSMHLEGNAARCSFCRISFLEVGPLAEGPDSVFICYNCLELCQEALEVELGRLARGDEG